MKATKNIRNNFILCLAWMVLNSVQCCEDYLRASLTDKNPCSQISLYSNCLMLHHTAMGLPFGTDVHRNIAVAVRNSFKQACNMDCPSRNMYNVSVIKKPETVGNELKVCAFDVFIASKANRRNACGKIQDMVRCILLKATDETYMLTAEAIDVGTFIVIDILKSTYGIKCPKQGLKQKLFEKCIGAKQAS